MKKEENKEMKIAFFGVKSWEREAIEKALVNLPVYGVGIFEEEVQDNLEVAAKYEVISPFIYSTFTRDVLAKLPNLKLIATRSTGVDHIDAEGCKRRGVEIASVPVYGADTVAEYAMALLLAITKKVVVAHQSVEEGDFSPEGLTGVDLHGKTMGVVGVGKIGQNVVRIARGFGMNVLGVDEYKIEGLPKKLGFEYVDLETCLKEADFVSLHVPSLPQTFHLINKKNIKLMKRGSYLINTSRGNVVETEALIWALNEGILAGAGIDVIEEETLLVGRGAMLDKRITNDDLKEVVGFHLLRDRDDVVFTPHNAFNTKEAIERIVTTTVENINTFIQSKSPKS